MMKKELLVIGHLNMDRIRTESVDAEESPGGGGMYTSFAAAIYGEGLDLLSTRCPDLPDEIFDKMADAKINTDNVLRILGRQRRSSMSYTSDFKRTNYAHHTDAWLGATIEQVPRHLPLVEKKYDFVYLAPLLAANQLLYAKWAKDNGAVVAMDISEYYARQNLDSLLECLKHTDIFMPSTVELDLMFPQFAGDIASQAKEIRSVGVSMLIVKCSTSGSLIYDFNNNFYTKIGIRPVSDAVDATGAGDTYNGGYISCYLHTGDSVISAKYAAVVASECIRDTSFRSLIGKTREDIFKIAKNLPHESFIFP